MVAKEALIPAGVTFLIAIGFTTINSFLLVYSEERGISNGSFFFTVYAVTMLATRPIVGKLTDKFGFVKVSIPAVFMTAASLFLIGQAHSTITLLVAAVVNAFGYGAVQPALQSLCMKSVVPERRGSASGTNYIAQDAATIVGPRICGWVANAAGYTPTMWNVMTIPVLLGIVFIVVFRNRINTIESEFAQRNATQVSK
jgi:MFS family permease